MKKLEMEDVISIRPYNKKSTLVICNNISLNEFKEIAKQQNHILYADGDNHYNSSWYYCVSRVSGTHVAMCNVTIDYDNDVEAVVSYFYSR